MYVFRDEIDKNKCVLPLGINEKYCTGSFFRFYPKLLLHNSVDSILTLPDESKGNVINFLLDDVVIGYHHDLEIADLENLMPDSLEVGYLHFDKVKIYQDSVLVEGGCRGYGRHLDLYIKFSGDVNSSNIKLDTFYYYVY